MTTTQAEAIDVQADLLASAIALDTAMNALDIVNPGAGQVTVGAETEVRAHQRHPASSTKHSILLTYHPGIDSIRAGMRTEWEYDDEGTMVNARLVDGSVDIVHQYQATRLTGDRAIRAATIMQNRAAREVGTRALNQAEAQLAYIKEQLGLA